MELKVYLDDTFVKIESVTGGDIDTIPRINFDYEQDSNQQIYLFSTEYPSSYKRALWSDLQDEAGAPLGASFNDVITFLDTLQSSGGGGEQTINITSFSGWGDYGDTQYTSVAPFSVSANTDTVVPNNAGIIRDAEKPSDITTFYDGTVITGNDGDGYCLTIDLKTVPTAGSTSYVEFWIDIGGGIPPLYKRLLTFPKGNGVERPITITTGVYTLNTWEANGGTVYVRSDGTCDLYDIRYVIHRLHKAGNEYVQTNSISSDQYAGIINSNNASALNPIATVNEVLPAGSTVAWSETININQSSITGISTHTQTGAITYTVGTSTIGQTLIHRLTTTTDSVSFDGFKKWDGSKAIIPNTLNVIFFFYDGTDHWYLVNQEASTVDPLLLISGVNKYVDFTNLDTITTGANFIIEEQSTEGVLTYEQSTASLQPTSLASGCVFDGVDDIITPSSNVTCSAETFGLFVVCTDVWNSDNVVVGQASGTDMRLWFRSNQIEIKLGGAAGVNFNTGLPAVTNTKKIIRLIGWNDAGTNKITLSIDGVDIETINNPWGVSPIFPGSSTIGDESALTSKAFDGTIACVYLVNGTPSAEDITTIEEQLEIKKLA